MKTVAVLISGGMDSVYAAYDRALNSDDPLILLHFELGDDPDYVQAMRSAARAAADWISANVRPVRFAPTPVSGYRAGGWWATEVIFLAIERCNAGEFDEIISGWCGENFSKERGVPLFALQRAMFARYASRGRLHYPIEHLTKVEMTAEMPTELRALTMSCHEPGFVNGRAVTCGTCRKCARQKYMTDLLASGVPPSEARALHLRKIAETPDLGGKGYRDVYADCALWRLLEAPAAELDRVDPIPAKAGLAGPAESRL
jgi:7-cyano-7-deazaguanine synthase in queuosine biosynthesis